VNRVFVGVTAILALSLAACVSSPKPETKKAEAQPAPVAKTEDKPAADPATLVLTDFEAAAASDFGSWKGGSSAIALELATDQAHRGKQSLKYTSSNKDYTGFAIAVPAETSDWNAYAALRFWVYGAKSGKTFSVYLEEDKGEQFCFKDLTDDFSGWKEFVLPFSQFQFRTDYQAGDATIDHKLQLNIKTIQIGPCSGDSSLYLDDFSLSK
jgi:hypothetical protein